VEIAQSINGDADLFFKCFFQVIGIENKWDQSVICIHYITDFSILKHKTTTIKRK